MEVTKYRVIAPEKIEEEKVNINKIPEDQVLVKTKMASICQADLRYFFGRRDPEILKQKYPICLLHEGIGEVLESKANYKRGDRVVIIPNIPCYLHKKIKKCNSCNNKEIGENYCEDVKFMSSNIDGIAQTYLTQPFDCLLKIPKDIPDEIATLTEIITVVYRASIELNINKKDRIIVFGCGPVGYFMAVTLRFINKIKKENLYVVDKDDNRLSYVNEFANTININKQKIEIKFDKAIECVGKLVSEYAIDAALNALKPKGTLMLLGVCEEKVPIRTRKILDLGLNIKGSTRSPRQDYPVVMEHLKDKDFQKALFKIIRKERFNGNSVNELKKAFYEADDAKKYGRVIIKWN